MAIIYKITNLINNKFYIGATRFNIEKRWAEHKYKSVTNCKSYLHRAIAKHGVENFKIEEIACCIGDWSECERLVIQSFNPKYNLTNGGEITNGRRPISDEAREKIRQSSIGKKRTPEQKLQMSFIKKEQLKNNPEYFKKALDALEKGRKNINQEKRLVSLKKAGAEGRMSRTMSEERKAKQLANINSPEARSKSIESNKKIIECLTLNTVFDSLIEAAEATGIHCSNISRVCLGKRRQTNGLIFKYI